MTSESELLGYRVRAARDARRPARVGALLAFAAGILNLVSVAVPAEVRRLGALRHWVPGEVSTTAGVVVAATGIGLLLLAGALRRRNKIAWAATTLLLFVSSIGHVLKGLDVEEALINMFLAGALAASGHYFVGGQMNRSRIRTAVFGFLFSIAGSLCIGAGGLLFADTQVDVSSAFSHTAQMIVTGSTDLELHHHTKRMLPLATQIVLFGGLLITIAELFAPQRKSSSSPAPENIALESSDSLAWFATRNDRQTLMVREAAISFGQSGAVALAAGDPLGSRADWPDAIAAFLDHSARRGQVAGVLACGPEARDLYERFEMKPIYMGDEAILDLETFSIDGGKMKTVRGSWKRAERAGYTSEAKRVRSLTDDEKSELNEVSDRWRGDEDERGFSMALGRLFGEVDDLAIVVMARDNGGRIRGFLHLVPWGPQGASLDVMRRDRDAINVMNDYLVVEAARELKAMGLKRLSLNFSALRSVLVAGSEKDATTLMRLQRRVLLLLSGSFQIETLYRFNKKFDPSWQPRYAMVELREDAPRVFYSALKMEGLLPKVSLRRKSGLADGAVELTEADKSPAT